MGSFSYLIVAGYPIYQHKNGHLSHLANFLFQSEDYIEERRSNKTRNLLFWGDAYKNAKGTYRFKGFRQSVRTCIQRLEIYGTNAKSSQQNFKNARKIAAASGNYGFEVGKVTYEQYVVELERLMREKKVRYDELFDSLSDSLMAGDLAIDGQQMPGHLYSVLSAVDQDAFVEYDLTDVIDGEWVKKADVIKIEFEKIIILTEGKTDAEFIAQSMKLLHPEIFPYYHFMDFEGFKVEAGVSALVKLLKAFAASNVKHPVIAIFDNDTAGIAEMDRLQRNPLPGNIKLLRLPNITLAKKYPTNGPSGLRTMNVNGLACGIEMYLGEELLKVNGKLSPIRWRDYNDSLRQYQGVLEDKELIQKNFRLKVKRATPWEMPEMELIVSCIFKAFIS